MNYRAIILAAGRGSRMGEETALKPKCLTTLEGRTLLSWQLEALKKAGIDKVTVVRGYRAEMIQGAFEVLDNKRWNKTNMVSSLFCVKESNVDTIVSYSDIVYKHEHVEELMNSDQDIVITADKNWEALWKLRFENPLDDAETFKSKKNKLIEIGNKTKEIREIEAQYMGLLRFSPKGWDTMSEIYESFSDEKKDKMDMTGMLNELLVRNVPVHVVFINGGWCEADNYSDILAYEKALENTKKWEHDWR